MAGEKHYLNDIDDPDIAGTTGNNSGDEVQATETVSGISERATQAETHAGTDDLRHITPLKLEAEKGIINGIASIGADGLIPPAQLPVGVGSVLATVNLIDGTTVSDTALYTVPAGKLIEVNTLVVRLTAITGGGNVPKIALGTNATTYDNIITATSVSGLTLVNDAYTFVVQGVHHIAQAAEVITMRIPNASSYTTYVLSVDLIGQIL